MSEGALFFIFIAACVIGYLIISQFKALLSGGREFKKKEVKIKKFLRVLKEMPSDNKNLQVMEDYFTDMDKSLASFFVAYMLREKKNYTINAEVKSGRDAGTIVIQSPSNRTIYLVAAKPGVALTIEAIKDRFSELLSNKNKSVWIVSTGKSSQKLILAAKSSPQIKLIGAKDMLRLALID